MAYSEKSYQNSKLSVPQEPLDVEVSKILDLSQLQLLARKNTQSVRDLAAEVRLLEDEKTVLETDPHVDQSRLAQITERLVECQRLGKQRHAKNKQFQQRRLSLMQDQERQQQQEQQQAYDNLLQDVGVREILAQMDKISEQVHQLFEKISKKVGSVPYDQRDLKLKMVRLQRNLGDVLTLLNKHTPKFED